MAKVPYIGNCLVVHCAVINSNLLKEYSKEYSDF